MAVEKVLLNVDARDLFAPAKFLIRLKDTSKRLAGHGPTLDFLREFAGTVSV